MKDLILIRYGEIGTKGGNRHLFEDRLIANIRSSLKELGSVKVYKTEGRIFVESEANIELVTSKLQQVFGIVGVCPAQELELDFELIKKAALKVVKSRLTGRAQTFKVETRRINKDFEYDSMEINRELGAYILQNTDTLSVDVHQPDIMLNVEIRYQQAYVYAQDLEGVGGLPVGSSGKAALLLSGGIDSPVAGWMAMKRGVELLPVYFHSAPYTSDRAREKVIDLARVLASYNGGSMKLRIVPFTEIQTAISEHCPQKLLTIIMRRLMMKIAEEITLQQEGKALITGESIGQVASQTLDSMKVTNIITNLPVFRPVIGFDKNEIEKVAQEIGTYQISIRPYDDCCTLFVPDNPVTKPKLKFVEYAEKNLELDKLVTNAITELEVVKVRAD